ncbi:MAG: hypothetical protein BWX87_00667 [Bacteroidetes bacterium ADurb.Bin123]|jgi:hypothetical protein|nr:MAG: hypothetical protein BWX87_00667 [Bacteroidetes bacterium ADurb.Bin123]
MEAENELLSYTEAGQYEAALNEFWEAWLTHENTDCLNAGIQSEMLMMYKHLRRFLNRIS